MELRTPRLVLREMREDDWRDIQTYAGDRIVCRFMEWGPNTPKKTRDFVRSVLTEPASRPRYNYNLVMTQDGTLVGAVRLTIRSRDDREADIGYVCSRPYWGRGYATEASRELLHFGFEKLRMHRIYATCDPRNGASWRVMEKLGMTREGHLRQHKFVKGAWRDSMLYAILEREWRAAARASTRASRRGTR